MFNGYRVSVWIDGKVLVMVAQHCECILMPLKNCLNGKFYVVYILPQFFKKHLQRLSYEEEESGLEG